MGWLLILVPSAPRENHEIIRNLSPAPFSLFKDLNMESVIDPEFRCFSVNQRGRKFPLSCHPGWQLAVSSALFDREEAKQFNFCC